MQRISSQGELIPKVQGHAAAATKEKSGFDFGGASELGALTQPPSFASVDIERAYLKERLAAAIRIFADQDYDHGGQSPARSEFPGTALMHYYHLQSYVPRAWMPRTHWREALFC